MDSYNTDPMFKTQLVRYNFYQASNQWGRGCVMACQATVQGLIPGGNSVKSELHVLCKGQ